MDSDFTKLDISKDFVIRNKAGKEELTKYCFILCKMRAGGFIICTKGTIRIKINLGLFTIQPNDFITLLPNTFFYIYELSDDAEVSFAAFSFRFLEGTNYIKTISSLILNLTRNPVIHLSGDIIEVYRMFFQLLAKTQNEPGSILFEDCMCSVQDILYKGVINMYKKYSTWKEPVMNREKEIVHEFIQLVWMNYIHEHKVSFYTAQLRISFPHFCFVIKKVTGMTPRDIIATVIISDAKVQLRSTRSSIKEIAINLGYHNVSFFDKYFRRYVGMSPLEYRNAK